MAKDLSTLKGLIEFAIEKESESQGLYSILAKQTKSARAAAVFSELSEEEGKHSEALSKLDPEVIESLSPVEVADLKISDYLHEVSFSPDMTYQDILVFAMKNEEHSHHLYKGLAAHADDEDVKKVFEFLARQEARHKLRLETEYDENILKED